LPRCSSRDSFLFFNGPCKTGFVCAPPLPPGVRLSETTPPPPSTRCSPKAPSNPCANIVSFYSLSPPPIGRSFSPFPLREGLAPLPSASSCQTAHLFFGFFFVVPPVPLPPVFPTIGAGALCFDHSKRPCIPPISLFFSLCLNVLSCHRLPLSLPPPFSRQPILWAPIPFCAGSACSLFFFFYC